VSQTVARQPHTDGPCAAVLPACLELADAFAQTGCGAPCRPLPAVAPSAWPPCCTPRGPPRAPQGVSPQPRHPGCNSSAALGVGGCLRSQEIGRSACCRNLGMPTSAMAEYFCSPAAASRPTPRSSTWRSPGNAVLISVPRLGKALLAGFEMPSRCHAPSSSGARNDRTPWAISGPCLWQRGRALNLTLTTQPRRARPAGGRLGLLGAPALQDDSRPILRLILWQVEQQLCGGGDAYSNQAFGVALSPCRWMVFFAAIGIELPGGLRLTNQPGAGLAAALAPDAAARAEQPLRAGTALKDCRCRERRSPDLG